MFLCRGFFYIAMRLDSKGIRFVFSVGFGLVHGEVAGRWYFIIIVRIAVGCWRHCEGMLVIMVQVKQSAKRLWVCEMAVEARQHCLL